MLPVNYCMQKYKITSPNEALLMYFYKGRRATNDYLQ